MMLNKQFPLFAPLESMQYGQRLAGCLGLALEYLDESNFPDGEFKISLRKQIEGQSVYLVQSLYHDPECTLDRKLCRLFFLSSTLKHAGARDIFLIAPYLAYSRQDRQENSSDPLTNQYLATLLEASGVTDIMTLDVHNLSAFQNAYRCKTHNLVAAGLFAHQLAEDFKTTDLAVISPDAGGVKRAKQFAKQLSIYTQKPIPTGMVDKSRLDHDVVSHHLFGDVQGKIAVLYDDIISTGSTVFHAARLCKKEGAIQVIAVATHGLFCGEASELLSGNEVDHIFVTDTIQKSGLAAEIRHKKLEVLSSVKLVTQAIRQLNPRAFEKPARAA